MVSPVARRVIRNCRAGKRASPGGVYRAKREPAFPERTWHGSLSIVRFSPLLVTHAGVGAAGNRSIIGLSAIDRILTKIQMMKHAMAKYFLMYRLKYFGGFIFLFTLLNEHSKREIWLLCSY